MTVNLQIVVRITVSISTFLITSSAERAILMRSDGIIATINGRKRKSHL